MKPLITHLTTANWHKRNKKVLLGMKGDPQGLEDLEIRGRMETLQTTALLKLARILSVGLRLKPANVGCSNFRYTAIVQPTDTNGKNELEKKTGMYFTVILTIYLPNPLLEQDMTQGQF